MARFYVEVRAMTSGECEVDAPSLEAVEAWLKAERAGGWQNWPDIQGAEEYEWDIGAGVPGEADPFIPTIDEAGNEIPQ